MLKNNNNQSDEETKIHEKKEKKTKKFCKWCNKLTSHLTWLSKNHVAHISYLNRVEEDSAKERSVATVYQEPQ